MSALDDRLLPVFARQHWLVGIDQVRAAGGTRDAADKRVRRGTWALADVEVFRLVGTPVTWEAGVLAPLLNIGDPACASHSCAARLHAISGFAQATAELSIPRGREHRRSSIIVHTSTDLDRCDVVDRCGVPTTDLERTLLDLGRHVGDQRLLRAIEACRRRKDTDWSALIATLAAHARRGRPGIQRFRRVIAGNMHREEVTDSDFELLFLALLAEYGLPTPELHHKVHDGQRFVAEVDLAYPQWRIRGRARRKDPPRTRGP